MPPGARTNAAMVTAAAAAAPTPTVAALWRKRALKLDRLIGRCLHEPFGKGEQFAGSEQANATDRQRPLRRIVTDHCDAWCDRGHNYEMRSLRVAERPL